MSSTNDPRVLSDKFHALVTPASHQIGLERLGFAAANAYARRSPNRASALTAFADACRRAADLAEALAEI
ncbi:hypothetical protein [Nocardia brasiliensis]|uniref:hypothetical protein n=1 Tax=Nocardia brasiliensis TaxID=37326 RepID=UPI002454A508|nr:hypothetical protein [Nocardia brasiliensis]